MALDFLVADASPATRRMIYRTLRIGAIPVDHIHEAGDADQARHLLDEHWVDGIITAWELWLDEDTRLAVWLTSDEVMHEVPTIVTTPDGRPATIEKISNRNIADLLIKPFPPEELYEKVKEIEPYDRV